LLGAIAHFAGWLVALIVWASQKEKSRFMRFQALQALAFDAVVTVGMVILSAGFAMLMVAGLFLWTVTVAASQGDPGGLWVVLVLLPALLPIVGMPFFAIAGLGIFAMRITAAVSVFQGRDFKYPWLGRQVEKFLES
jgi:uncharacterized Tic20 family protein